MLGIKHLKSQRSWENLSPNHHAFAHQLQTLRTDWMHGGSWNLLCPQAAAPTPSWSAECKALALTSCFSWYHERCVLCRCCWRITFCLLLGQRTLSVSDGEEFVDVRYVSMGKKWTFLRGESTLCLVHSAFLVLMGENRPWGLSAGIRGLPGAMKKGYETKMNLNGTLSHSPWKTIYKAKI